MGLPALGAFPRKAWARSAPSAEHLRKRDDFAGTGRIRAVAAGDRGIPGHCAGDSLLPSANIHYGWVPGRAGPDHPNPARTGRRRLVRESPLFPRDRSILYRADVEGMRALMEFQYAVADNRCWCHPRTRIVVAVSPGAKGVEAGEGRRAP
jgi:hypothetical protein